MTVAELGAILEYLVLRYGNGRLAPPVRTPQWVRYTYWMHYAEGWTERVAASRFHVAQPRLDA